MSKHSPAPWIIGEGHNIPVFTEPEPGHDPYFVAAIAFQNMRQPRAEVEANAHLIAASPALLDAARTAVEKLYRWHSVGILGTDYGLCPEEHDCLHCNTIRVLQAAIVKATGDTDAS